MITKRKKYILIFLLTLSCLCYNLPYLSTTFYTQFIEAFNLSNKDAGFLMTMFSLTATPGYLFGGMLADKFSAKKLLITSQLMTAVLGFVMSFINGYTVLLVCYLGFGLSTTFVHWSAFMKLIRAQATDNDEGKVFGIFEFSYAAVGAITSYGILAALSNISNFRIVTSIYAALLVVVALIIIYILRDAKESEESVNDFNMKMVGKALTHPVTWINGFLVMGMYIIITGSSYLNPYLTTVFGVSVTFGTSLTILNRTVLRLFFTPIGGIILDKWKTPKFMISIAVLITATCAAMLFIPQKESAKAIAIIIALVMISIIAGSRSGLYTPIPEAKVPFEILGTSIGLASAIGYSTDLWLYGLCGKWIDEYGAAGYRNIIYLFIAGMILVVVSSVLLYLYEKKNNVFEEKEA